jgi:Calcium-dependent channel, 7TM region, putative phosphate
VPQEIIWENAHIPKKMQLRRENLVNFVLVLGVFLWSFPLAAIQVFAKAENLAQIPGMEWILYVHGGSFGRFVNGYLPVVALLTLISVLPVIFEYIAVKYERRKTISDVQSSMLGRYFYYQLANIYVTVTAGSILRSLAEILNHPSYLLKLLGQSLPTMVGYFVALLVTKILAGLPMIFLRFGALTRMLLLRTLSDENKLTQRELDAVYRLENVQYGWEFPTQLLVVVIVFTYAVISPIILPFGLLYFMGALTVYKKQILYVYSPVYESGGTMFPIAVQRSLFGLVCAQVTFWGYLFTQECFFKPIFLFPLPLLTVYGMGFLKRTYAIPSERLSLERACECDRRSAQEQQRRSFQAEDPATLQSQLLQESSRHLLDHGAEARRSNFDKSKYRQPVLTELAAEPWTYRRGLADDAETIAVRHQLRQINRYIIAHSEAERRRLGDLASPT